MKNILKNEKYVGLSNEKEKKQDDVGCVVTSFMNLLIQTEQYIIITLQHLLEYKTHNV